MGRQNGQHAYTWANVGFFIYFICKFGAILGLPGSNLAPSWGQLGATLTPCWTMLEPCRAFRAKVVFCATSSNEIALRHCPIAILRPSRCHTRPSRGPLAALPEVALDRKKQYKSAPFSFHYVKVFQSRSDDRFLPKCVFCTTSSIQNHFRNRILSILVAARTIWEPSRGRP